MTSLQNDKVKQWVKLHKRKGRSKAGMFLAEGFHVVEEAYENGWNIVEIILQEGIDCPGWCQYLPVTFISKSVMQHVAQTETPQGIAATVTIKESEKIDGDTVILLDGLQDPGNVGTIIRTADAAGFDSVVLGEGTVDLYNDKVIRSTQGSLFHLPVVQADLKETISSLQQEGFTVWAASVQNATSYEQLPTTSKTALIVGNEGAGIREEIIRMSDQSVRIPIRGKAESLNVSIAAGVLMYYINN
ncbi:RNA methyltransferase [Lentibacillus halophilus]|uniref:RNA methyltransferase n=1 Tax=Lentibacillus halophilus TaxID=295065 RepID=A0ABN0Z1W7_9BACI